MKIDRKPKNELAKKLIEYRESLNLTQEEMSKEYNFSLEKYIQIEKGLEVITLKELIRISLILDISSKKALHLYEKKIKY